MSILCKPSALWKRWWSQIFWHQLTDMTIDRIDYDRGWFPSSALLWKYEGRDPSSCLAPPSLASDASLECGRETSGVTGSSFDTPSLVRRSSEVVILFCLKACDPLVVIQFDLVFPTDLYVTDLFFWSDHRSSDRFWLTFWTCPFHPLSGAAVQPVRGASCGGGHLWLWRQHHRGAVCTMDAARGLLPIYEKS